MKILVTGATGHFGGLVVENLQSKLEAGQLVVSVRDPKKAEKFVNAGIEVRQGDFDEPETLADTFSGIDRLLIVSTDGDNQTRMKQHENAINAAKQAGVKHLFYTSIAGADSSSLSLAEVHRFTESAIQAAGMSYTFLRNNWYLENELGSIEGAKNGAPWVSATGNGKIGYTLRREYAEAAANALVGEGHDNRIYELSSQPVSQKELAEAVAKAIHQPVQYLAVDADGYAQGLKDAGLPEFVIELLVGFQTAMADGALDVVSGDLETLLGRKPLSLDEAVAELV